MTLQTYIPVTPVNEPETAADQEQSAFWQQVNAFKAKAAEFIGLYNQLGARGDIAALEPQLARDYEALMSAGASLKSRIADVTAAIDWGNAQIDRFRSWFGMSGHDVSELGLAPLVLAGVIATIVGGLALMGNWVANAYTMSKRLDVAKFQSEERARLIAQGHSPDEAARIARASYPEEQPGIISQITTLAIWAAIGLGVFWLVRQAQS